MKCQLHCVKKCLAASKASGGVCVRVTEALSWVLSITPHQSLSASVHLLCFPVAINFVLLCSSTKKLLARSWLTMDLTAESYELNWAPVLTVLSVSYCASMMQKLVNIAVFKLSSKCSQMNGFCVLTSSICPSPVLYDTVCFIVGECPKSSAIFKYSQSDSHISFLYEFPPMWNVNHSWCRHFHLLNDSIIHISC